jgi:type IV secretory pathway component VirB8
MRQATEEKVIESEIDKLKNESNMEATIRISAELKAETKLKERKHAVMNWFKGLTGREMTEAEFIVYNSNFNKAESGYNIKSFMRDIGANEQRA